MDRVKISIQRADERGVREMGYYLTPWIEAKFSIVAHKIIKITDQNGKALYEFAPPREK